MQTADLIFVSVSGLMFDVYNILWLIVIVFLKKMASENSSEDEIETLHGPVRPYLFEPTAKPGAESIKLPQRDAKLVLGLFDNVNFKFVFIGVQTLR